MDKKKLFLVEDDPNFGAVLKSYLEIHNYEVDWINDGALAINKFTINTYDLCILDVMLPNVDGFEIGRSIRSKDARIPMIFLTAKTLKSDILQGFSIGADDYITKPFDSEVLLCKINVILKRNTEFAEQEKQINDCQIGIYSFNYPLRTISLKGKKDKLSPKEADLLKLLYLHKNNILARDNALQKVWGDPNYFTTRSMDVYISKLRKYFSDDKRIEITNIHGSGFKLSCPEE